METKPSFEISPAGGLRFEQVFELLKRRYRATEDDMGNLIPRVVRNGPVTISPGGRQVRVSVASRHEGYNLYTVEEL